MLRKEFKCNFKNLTIWGLITIVFLVIIYLVYPNIIKENENMSQMMNQMFSKEILEAFNMDIVSFDSVLGWIVSEGYVMITLLLASYFAIMGGSIVLKEHHEKTIYFLYSKPVSKNKILTSKIIAGLIYILIFNILIAITNLIGLALSNDLDFNKWLWISVLPIILSIFFFFICLFISMYLKKTSSSIGVNLGVVFGFYMINILSLMTDKLEFLKFFSPFYYIDARDVLVNGSPDLINIIMLGGISIIFALLSYYEYDKKELGL